ncbi:hypothetical protein [Limnochorda pilosa]|uniref:Uncharacterized protein n=1 Tax=Limnochorda pilosa TaxID=1555112 RepID=A0A0K2SPZ5_LIMPI|nr:hypothetical protein [Limnochorda pilosa]BAS29188.1 hypothetical protein LIP_3376 [Limnochorda pilosa]
MAKTKQEIIDDITAHFKGQAYRNCYVGITAGVDTRLFGDHNVSRDNGHWIHRTASSHTVARDVEKHFLDAGMDGGGGGGSDDSRIVYAYKKTSSTRP